MKTATIVRSGILLCLTLATTPACAPLLRPDWCVGANIQTPANVLWARQFRGEVSAMGLEIDATGNVAMVGWYKNRADLDDDFRVESNVDLSNDMFVAKLDAQGKTLWTRRFSGPGVQVGHDVAFERDGNVIAVGEMSGIFDFGTGELKGSPHNATAVVVKLDASDRTQWAKLLPDAAQANSVAVDASGNAYVTAIASDGLAVMKLDPEGKVLFDVRLGPSEDGARVVTDGKGHLVVVWKRIAQSIVLLGEKQHGFDYGEQKLWIAKLDEAGHALWNHAQGEGKPRGVAIDARGNILIVSDTSNDETLDGVATKLTEDGRPLWTRRLGPRMSPSGVTVNAKGNMVVFRHVRRWSRRVRATDTRTQTNGIRGQCRPCWEPRVGATARARFMGRRKRHRRRFNGRYRRCWFRVPGTPENHGQRSL